MKIIVCGAGQVGFYVAKHLAMEGNEVTVIDTQAQLVGKATQTLDVRGVVGSASYPDVLEKAGAREADMLIGVTKSDEVNMLACQIGHSLFDIPTKVARIRSQNYLQPEWAGLYTHDHLPVDIIISPEYEIAQAVARRLDVPGCYDMISLADDKVRILGIKCPQECPILNTPLKQLAGLFPSLNVEILGIIRNERLIVPSANDQILMGDTVYCVVDTRHVSRVLLAFGVEEIPVENIVIVGGGNVGFTVAKLAQERETPTRIKLIERNQERAEYLAQQLPGVMVLQGDIFDEEIIQACEFDAVDAIITVTNQDEANILGSQIGKKNGAGKAIALINHAVYRSISDRFDIDGLVNPRSITVSSILQHIRRGRILSVYNLKEEFGEIIEAEALKTSPIVGIPLKDFHLPAGIMIGAVVRGDEVLIPNGQFEIEVGDHVILLTSTNHIKRVEKMFTVRADYF